MEQPVSPELKANQRALRRALGRSADLVIRRFTCSEHGTREGMAVYMDVLAHGKGVERLVEAAMRFTNPPYERPSVHPDPVRDFAAVVMTANEYQFSTKLSDAILGVLSGDTAFFLAGSSEVLIVDTRYNPGRQVAEPTTEAEARGPRDGFVENIRVNSTLIRRRIRHPGLRFKNLQLGRSTQTDVDLVYIKGPANPQLVREVYRRLKRIDIDGVISSGQVEELIRDTPYSQFGSLLSTERPDKVVAGLLEGRVAIVVDNTPFVLIAPTTFWMFLQAPGDYYQGYWAGTAFRLIRFVALLMALTFPSLYVILATFHHEMIPTPLALSMAAGHEGTPLPTLVEVVVMEVMFEVIHEAGLRLPRAVGQTVSIVGALVIGEAAVQAGLVAPATVIVIATAGITGFALPIYSASLAVRLARFPLLLISGVLGVFGFITATSFLALHMSSLRSFGAPYLAPAAPLQVPELRDSLVRAPYWQMDRLPRIGSGKRLRRQAPNAMPSPARGKSDGGKKRS